MDHPKTWSADTLVRLQMLTAQLAAQIVESQEARARLARALEASAWPDVPAALLRAGDGGPAQAYAPSLERERQDRIAFSREARR